MVSLFQGESARYGHPPPKKRGENLSLPLAKHPRGDRGKVRRCPELVEGMWAGLEIKLVLREFYAFLN